jgi:hypothetical protein
LSSSTCMDILRNKSRTCKVSNQQHIFQKMADPILFMSRGFPLTVGALTLHSFSSACLLPKKSPPRLFLSPPTPRRDGLQPGGMLTRRAPDMFNRRTTQTCKERNNHAMPH